MRILFIFALFVLLAAPRSPAAPVVVRVVAANLTSDRYQRWSPDNGNHSNPEGAGARILKALRPDVVLIQEFNTSIPVRQWVNATFGPEYAFTREDGDGIPNGVISRFPIAASGEWDDPLLANRDFAWARIALPGGHTLWAVSVHFHAKRSDNRRLEAEALLACLRREVPEGDMVVLGGDFNTRTVDEPCLAALAGYFRLPDPRPADHLGDADTNAPRNRPYDWVLADNELQALATPVAVAGRVFPGGLVFDTRTFPALAALAPAQAGDSALKQMQHMAVVRDFALPDGGKKGATGPPNFE